MSDDETEKFKYTGCYLDHEFNMNRQCKQLSNSRAIYGISANNKGRVPNGDAEPFGFGGRRRKDKKVKKDKKKKHYRSNSVSFVTGGILIEGKEFKIEDTKDDKEEYMKDNTSSYEEKTTFSFNNDEDLADLGIKPSQMNPFLGDWVKHTKGIGTKLLLGMGYQPGRGLGKKLQGITVPIEASIRKGRGAIGAYGPEFNSKSTTVESKCVAEKTEYINKTVEEFIEESEHPVQSIREFNKLCQVKVIGMTEPEQNDSGYHAISDVKKPINHWEVQKDNKFTNFDMTELLQHLDPLYEISAQNIVTNNQETSFCEDHLVLKEEDMKDKDNSSQILENILLLETYNEGLKQNNMLNFAEMNYSDYWLNGGLDFVLSTAQKLIREKLSLWDPFQEPYLPFKELKKWKELLIFNGFHSSDEFKTLIWQEWVPKMQNACQLWNSRDYSSMLQLIIHSSQLIPSDIINHVFVSMVLPKIQSEVELWDPFTDPVQVNLWIHPWLPYLSKHFETIVYPTIRLKLGAVLKTWHPSDNSAIKMLEPWIDVFQQECMEIFLIKNIVPKLQAALQTFVINPYNQQLDNWNWVILWSDILPLRTLVELLDQHFFPKWLMTLSTWIKINPDHGQIRYWYIRWKFLMPVAIIEHPTIMGRFQSALDIMSQATREPFMPQPPQPVTIYSTLAEAIRIASQMNNDFKEFVQKQCEEHGILWMPIPGLYKESEQVYTCGSRYQAYIDHGDLFISLDGTHFIPISVQSMLELFE